MPSERTPLVSETEFVTSPSAIAVILLLAGGLFSFSGVGYLSVLFMVPHLEKHPGVGGLRKEGVTEAQSLFFVGAAVSCLVVLPFADKVGRKVPMYALVVCMLLATIAECGATVTWTYAIGVFCVGAFECPATILGYVLSQECVHEKYRNTVAVAIKTFLSVNIILMSLSCKYLTPQWNWRTERLLWYTPFMAILLVGPFVISDSPHFRAGKASAEEKPDKSEVSANNGALERSPVARILEPDLRGVLAATCYCWLACSVSWYSLAYAAGKISSDVYIDTALMACVDIGAYVFYAAVITRLGALRTQALGFALTSVELFLCVWLSKGSFLMVTLAMLARLTSNIAYTTCFVLLIECFPLECRSTASGAANFFARMLAFVSPMAALIPPRTTFLVLSALNILGVWATFACLRVPDREKKVDKDKSVEGEPC